MFPRKVKRLTVIICTALFCLIYVMIRNSEEPDYEYEDQIYQDSNVLEERQSTLQDVCDALTGNQALNSSAHHLYKDESRQVLYCSVPGAESGFLLRVLATSKQTETSDRFSIVDSITEKELAKLGIDQISNFDREPAEVLYKVQDYFKFLFARNPFARILSIYLKKFSGQAQKDRRTDKLIGAIRSNLHQDPDSAISFTEFLKYVIDDVTTSSKRFWRPIYGACLPCLIDYSLIGKLETFEADFYSCLDEIERGDPKARIILQKVLDEINYIDHELETYWKDVPLELVHSFVEAYKMDFKLFGYDNYLGSYFKPDKDIAEDGFD